MFVIRNVRIFDGRSPALSEGQVTVEGQRITAAGPSDAPPPPGATVIDGQGDVLMPGLVDGHTHLGFPFSVSRKPAVAPRGGGSGARGIPTESKTLLAAYNAEVMLDHGFTSAYSGGAGSLLMDVAVQREIDAGFIPGPRFVPAGQEGDAVGRDVDTDGVGQSDDPEAARDFLRASAQGGAKVGKFVLSGPSFMNDTQCMYSDAVLAAAADEARAQGVWLSGHCRPAEAIKQGLRNGFRVLYHCDQFDEEALDMAEAMKDRVFIGPTVGLIGERLESGAPAPFPLFEGLDEVYARNIEHFRKRGLRMVVGGDYGFERIPHGNNARDILYLVKYFGLSPAEALVCATGTGGELMDMPLGQVTPGYLADLILVRGDPTRDISVLTEKANIGMVMKGGDLYRLDRRTTVAGAPETVH